MTWTYSEDFYKRYTRDTWNESAAGYAPVMRNLDLANPALLDAAAPRAGERVLDVATGLGEPALSLAPRVAPGGSVLGVDLSERMVELARSAAKSRGLDHVRFEVMDAEELALPDASFDLAVCRFGLQIVTNPDKAMAELLRVVRPGGRAAATVWGAGERSPAIHAIIGPMLEHAEPDETGYLPTPYEMGGEGELADALRKAGFRDASEKRLTMTQRYPGVEEYLRAMLQGTPIGHSLHEEDEDVQRAVIAKTRAGLQAHLQPDGSLALPAEYVVVVARR